MLKLYFGKSLMEKYLFFCSVLLFEHWIRYPLDHLRRPDMYFNINRDHFSKVNNGGPFWETMAEAFSTLPNGQEIRKGKLASVIVGGGKRRLFIIL